MKTVAAQGSPVPSTSSPSSTAVPELGDRPEPSSLPAPATTAPIPAPSHRWTVNDDLIVEVALPPNVHDNPLGRSASEADHENGLFVLQSWFIDDNPTWATLSVYTVPVGQATSTLPSYAETYRTPTLEWGLRRSGPDDPRPELVFAYATVGRYELQVSAPDGQIFAILDGVRPSAVSIAK